MRIAIVDNEKLKDMARKKHIQSICPVNRAGKECIRIEDDGKMTIVESLCIGCGLCPKAAPEAIKIINLPEALKEEPVHRYGENMFALYSLPTPTFGNVVGIIGVNGIGKSTAIKILAQIIKPNIGNYKKEGDFKLLLEKFKGTEAQTFFEKIRDGKITVSYKPQQVSLIPKNTLGKVEHLLRKVDQKDKFDEVVEKLQLKNFLQNDISKISGGELQRVAIAATVLKKADVYIFDEPTTYLDIKQRLLTAKFIKSMVEEDVAVMVIEHDLIALDFMTDYVHIMYGKETGYGVVSQKKSSKVGINAFLHGYLKDDNIRFRDHTIKFEVKPPSITYQREKIVEWPKITKKLGNFKLTVNPGEIKKRTIVGILGENGTGKTSFVKILAGIDKADNIELKTNLKISYKPQYIENDRDELVINYLQEAMKKHHEIIKTLNLQDLMMSKLNELSGGELQKVEIAKALAKDAQLVLLDEPSAYLDIEQRLIVAKMIKNIAELKGISVLVVDHDLLFLDYLSDELIVFKGEPAIHGTAEGPMTMEQGMNSLLKEVNITLRREEQSGRPRINKEESLKDREQKENGNYYYS